MLIQTEYEVYKCSMATPAVVNYHSMNKDSTIETVYESDISKKHVHARTRMTVVSSLNTYL